MLRSVGISFTEVRVVVVASGHCIVRNRAERAIIVAIDERVIFFAVPIASVLVAAFSDGETITVDGDAAAADCEEL